jgi:hypothetical protein
MQFLAEASRKERARKGGRAGGRGRCTPADSSPITSRAELTRNRDTEVRSIVSSRYGVSQRKIRYAQMLRQEAPDAFESVKSGNERLVVAKRRLDRERARQELRLRAAECKTRPISWDIRCGDCLNEMKNIQSATVRLIFTDPPYNIGIDYGQGEAADRLDDRTYLDWCREVMNC